MAKTFRSWDVDQGWLLPPSVHEFVPPGHLAHFVRDTVREALDLSAILSTYKEERGFPPYHPGMMVALRSTATAAASTPHANSPAPVRSGSMSWRSQA